MTELPSLQRKMGAWTATSIVVGSMIGSSIFMKPALMAGQLGSPVLLVGVWVFAGIISLMGAMIIAEIGCVYPDTGGTYVYLEKMYGDFPAFLYGWSSFIVINTGAVAAICFIFSQYLGYILPLDYMNVADGKVIHFHLPGLGEFYPLDNLGVKIVSIVTMVLLTWLNSRSVKASGRFQLFTTIIKVLSFVFLLFMIFFSGKGEVHHFIQPIIQKGGWELALAIVAATAGAFAAYDGWINLSLVGGEIRNPSRNIPLGLVSGVMITMAVYVLTNLAFLYVLPVNEMAGSSLIATDALYFSSGSTAAVIIAFLVMLSTFNSANANIMATGRVTFAMAQQKLFIPPAGRVHPRYQTPFRALWLNAAWTIILIISGSFDMLTEMFVFNSWLFYGLLALGYLLKRKYFDAPPGSYKAAGFPVLPGIFLAFTFFYLILTVINDIQGYLAGKQPVVNSLYGLLLTLMGVPVYLFRKKRKIKSLES